MRFSFSQATFALMTALGLATLGVAAPGGHVLIGTPTIEKVAHDPSVRAGSSHLAHHWYSTGGGYHGGK